ncbi:MAG: GNAT family N-acetyltransferase [Candidatus Kariarchaeaceae archaeon]|jgi:ribosomal protein S18 acetylase RimI-like enzyme
MTASGFRIELIKRTRDEMIKFAKSTMELVKEYDKKSVSMELDHIRSQFHIDNCWIFDGEEKVGVVKIHRSTFYALGLLEKLSDSDILNILKLIVSDISPLNVQRIEGTLHSDYVKFAEKIGFKHEFSREKLYLNLNETSNIRDFQDLDIRTYRVTDFKQITNMFIDAYQGSVDERIGMFGKEIAYSAIQSIIRGNFGEFKTDLSAVVLDDKGEIMAGVMTTISEEIPFIIIIGVSRKSQNLGLGRKLLSWIIAKLGENQYESLKLWVTVENRRAYQLYKSMGFQSALSVHTLYL